MKRLDQALDIGPMYASQFERNGIRTITDLAKTYNLADLSLRTGIPLEMVQQWHERARQRVKTSRYRRKVAIGIVIVALLVLSWELRAFRQSVRISAQADALYDKGEYEQAIRLYNKVTDIDPTYELAFANRGAALRMVHRYPEALASLDKAIELNPQDVWAYNQRGDVYSDSGNYKRAIVDYNKALELDPKYKFAYSKASDLRRLGRFGDALDALNQGITIDPQWTWAYEERGSIYHDNLFQYEAAYDDLKKAHELENSPTASADFAEAALSSGHFTQAYDLASKLSADDENAAIKKLDVSSRLAMRLVAISALLLEGDRAQAKLEMEQFVTYYKSAASTFKEHWDYSGTRHFIAESTMDRGSKSIILDLIKLLQKPPETTIDRIEESVSTFR